MLRFVKDQSGVGAIEFALIAPLLALVFLGLASTWSYMKQSSDMRDAVEAASKYYVMGGTNDTKATSIAQTAWATPPAGGQLTVNRVCSCLGVTLSCAVGGVCSDQTVPHVSLIITATSAWTDPYASTLWPQGLALSQSETIRVR